MNFLSAKSCELSSALYDSLAGYRYKVFVERMGWDLDTQPGYEQDQFDAAETVHIVARNAAGRIVGCGRLLPTTGRYLLEEVFPQLFNGLPTPRNEKVWELSRFAAADVDADADEKQSPGLYLAERVLLRAIQFCADRGVTHLLAVTTLAVERLMQRAGVDLRRFGPPSMIGGQMVLAVVIAVNDHTLNALLNYEIAALSQRKLTSPNPRLAASLALSDLYRQLVAAPASPDDLKLSQMSYPTTTEFGENVAVALR